jgi:hypothetical protein
MSELGRKLSLTLVALSDTLSRCWDSPEYRGKRHQDGILDQEVDKLALLLMQTWPKPLSPFTPVPGRHGPGPALPRYGRTGEYVYVCDVLEMFQEQVPPENRQFEVTRGFGPWRYFAPRMKVTQRERWARKYADELSPNYETFVTEFVSLIRELSPAQVIALGRHTSPNDTLKALQTLSGHLAAEAQAMLGSSGQPEQWWLHASNVQTLARVIHEKAITDRGHYTEAKRLIARRPDCMAKSAILSKRGGAEEIWEHSEIARFAEVADALSACAYVVWTASFIGVTQALGIPAGGAVPSDAEEEMQQALLKWTLARPTDGELNVAAMRKGDFAAAKMGVQNEFHRPLSKIGQTITGKLTETNVA